MKFSAVFLTSVCLYAGVFAEPPPRQIPDELYEQFTLGGKVPVIDWYLDNTLPKGTTIQFPQRLIEEYIQMVQRRESGCYKDNTDQWLYQTLEKHPIEGKEVGIFGSQSPFYECVVLAYGGHPITVEYNEINCEDPRITTYTVEEFNKNPRKFDVILSISSIEHDGLGRYGDPINPNGDLEFMAKATSFLKENGHMILAVPVGPDALAWNAHRMYGPLRFPLLIKEWTLVDSFGFSERDFTEKSFGQCHQPILYLKPK
ncbi:MAG: DUF268 domain-containing protein [Parachlamydiales bacterium]|nr:DUF268 domain-containing protein [Candidatus Acheromyda pituitae]